MGSSAARSIGSVPCTSGAVQIGLDQLVDLGRGVSDPARQLFAVDAIVQEGKRLRHGITELELRLVDVRSCGR